MDASDLMNFLLRAGAELGCTEVLLRCECKNLETVYAVDRSGVLVVTDAGDTFEYLGRGTDDTYGPVGAEHARSICHRHGVKLDDEDPDLYPRVWRAVADGPVGPAIEAVAAAVDEIFAEHRSADARGPPSPRGGARPA